MSLIAPPLLLLAKAPEMLKALSLETDVGGIVRSDLRSLFRLSVSFPVSSKVANSVDKLLKKKIKFCYEWCSIEISRFPDFPGSLDPARPGQSLSRPVPGISRPVLSIVHTSNNQY